MSEASSPTLEHLNRRPVAYALLLAAALIPGIAALGGPFFSLDDQHIVLKNPFVHGQRPFLSMFTQSHSGTYGPMHELAIYLQWSLFGFSPVGFRIVSLLLHAAAAIGCFHLFQNLTGRPRLALGAAALWAMHPAQSECVAWIVEQKALLCHLFFFWAMAVYTGSTEPRWQRTLLATGLAVLSCMGKSTGLVAGPIAVMYELFVRPQRRASHLLHTLPLLALMPVFVIVALRSNESMELLQPWSKHDFIANLPGTLLLYLKLAVRPWTASFFHDLEYNPSLTSAQFWGPLLILVVVAALGLASMPPPKRKLLAFIVLAWPLALGPVANISVATWPGRDRYSIMALAFLLLGLTLLVERVLQLLHVLSLKDSPRAQPSPPFQAQALPPRPVHELVWAVVLLPIALLGVTRGALFNDELSVFLDSARKAPNNANTHGGIAMILSQRWSTLPENSPERLQLATTIAPAALRATHCWSFNYTYPMPVVMCTTAAQVCRFSGMFEEAEALLEVATSPRWAMFYHEQRRAKEMRSELPLQQAEWMLQAASLRNVPPEDRSRMLAQVEALFARGRERGADADALLWLQSTAAMLEAAVAKAAGDTQRVAEKQAAARNALAEIRPLWPHYAKVQARLAELGP